MGSFLEINQSKSTGLAFSSPTSNYQKLIDDEPHDFAYWSAQCTGNTLRLFNYWRTKTCCNLSIFQSEVIHVYSMSTFEIFSSLLIKS